MQALLEETREFLECISRHFGECDRLDWTRDELPQQYDVPAAENGGTITGDSHGVRPLAVTAVSHSGTRGSSGEITGSKRHYDGRRIRARKQGTFQKLSPTAQKLPLKFFSELFLVVHIRSLHLGPRLSQADCGTVDVAAD